MLKEGKRLITPEDTKQLVPWEKLEGVVILGLAREGEINTLYMSSVSVNELAFLSKQLDAHVTCLLGPMIEE